MFRLAGRKPTLLSKFRTAKPSCLMLFWHCVRAAASRTFCTAGTSSAIKIAMIAITTSNSINVKPRRRIAMFLRDASTLGLFREESSDVPERDVAIDATGGERRSIGRKRDHLKTQNSLAPRSHDLPRREIPHVERAIPARGGEQAMVRRQRQRTHEAVVPFELAGELRGRNVPHANDPVLA